MPGRDFILAWRKLELERSSLFGNGMERVIEHAYKSAHPFMNIAANRKRNLGLCELRLVHHAFHWLPDIELRILFGPRVDVVKRHIAVLNLERLIRHHCEHVWNIVAVLLIDLHGSRGSSVTGPCW